MRRILSLIVVLAVCSQVYAGLLLIEDFNSSDMLYINMDWYWDSYWPTYDHSSVVPGGIHDYLSPLRGDIDPPTFYYLSYTEGKCLQLDNFPAQQQASLVKELNASCNGTIYMCFKSSGMAFGEIGLTDDFSYMGYEGEYIPQQLQGSLFGISAGTSLTINSVDAYDIDADIWYELWIHCDAENKCSRYYIAPVGGAPEVIENPADQSQWWQWQNQNIYDFMYLTLYSGGVDATGNIQIDQLAADNSGYSLDSLYMEPGQSRLMMEPSITPFLVLKSNYGTKTGATLGMGDLDGDGDVDVHDFLIFRSYYCSNFGSGN